MSDNGGKLDFDLDVTRNPKDRIRISEEKCLNPSVIKGIGPDFRNIVEIVRRDFRAVSVSDTCKSPSSSLAISSLARVGGNHMFKRLSEYLSFEQRISTI